MEGTAGYISLEFRETSGDGNINSDLVSMWGAFKALGMDEITQSVQVESKKERCERSAWRVHRV